MGITRLAVIGLGRWGMNYVRTLAQMPEVELVGLVGRPYQFDSLEIPYRTIFKEDWREVCNDQSLDGLIVATTPESHYEIVKFALERRVPTLVEKPFTLSASQTNELALLSKKLGVLCMVNYIHLYSRGYNDLKQKITEAGRIKQIYTDSYGNGPFRSNVPVLWDWGCHDISMCLDILGELPLSIDKTSFLTREDQPHGQILRVKLKFSRDLIACLTFGNLAEYKRRDLCVVCNKGIFIYDGLSQGLSKNYSNLIFLDDKFKFNTQISPLECAIREYLSCINQKVCAHYTLELARNVNNILSELK